NRLCPRVNTDASKILRLRNFQKCPQSMRLKSAGALSSLTVQSCVFTKIIFAFDQYSYLRHSETVRLERLQSRSSEPMNASQKNPVTRSPAKLLHLYRGVVV